ncbi:MAG: hypothetical protein KAY24_19985 [Candidatus Eisenbacteria sp.]|nr:hypothetical protein [Candidatus Eisenbacteria bacterium]
MTVKKIEIAVDFDAPQRPWEERRLHFAEMIEATSTSLITVCEMLYNDYGVDLGSMETAAEGLSDKLADIRERGKWKKESDNVEVPEEPLDHEPDRLGDPVDGSDDPDLCDSDS